MIFPEFLKFLKFAFLIDGHVSVCVGVLLVVSVGVALGVFVGGVLLVAAARYFKRFNNARNFS